MKLVADEGVDKPIVDHLRSKGYDIIYIMETSPGLQDSEVLSIANKKKAVLITMDTDFGELVYRLKESTYGVLLLRIAGLSTSQKQHVAFSVLEKHHDEIENSFSVVTEKSIRIRQL